MTHDDILTALQSNAMQIEAMISGLTDEQLSQRRADGHWSLREVIGHLHADADLFLTRFRCVVQEDNPTIHSVAGGDVMVAEGGYGTRPVEPVIAELAATDQQIADLLAGLDVGGWQRTGQHEERGQLVLEQWVGEYVAHEHEHIEEIAHRLEEVS